MKPGETIERGWWLKGSEPPDARAAIEDLMREDIAEVASGYNVLHGVVTFHEKRIGEPRVGEPPKNFNGPDVRLLVAESEILAYYEAEPGFVTELEAKDLERLRERTRAAYSRAWPWKQRLTDAECDEIINAIGPDAALDELRRS